MKIFRFLIPMAFLAVTAFGQVTMTQAPGSYTDTSIPVRSGTYNRYVDAPLLTYTSGTNTLSANISGNAATATSSTSTTNATNIGITDDTATNATMFPLWVTANTGNLPAKVTSTKLSFNPSTGTTTSTSFSGLLNSAALTLSGVASPSYAQGKLVYDTDSESLTFFNNDSAVGLQIGQETWMRVRNDTGSTITNGSVVYISGTSGVYPQISLANANSVTAAMAIGLTTESISTGTIGIVTTYGTVHGLNTLAFPAGTRVYLGTTNGTLTATIPSNPNSQVAIGIVVVSSATVGSIAVSPSSGRIAGTLAFTNVAQTFTGVQAFTSPSTATSITTASTSFTAWAGATTLLTFGGTGASASTFLPSTLDATTSTTGALRTSGGISAAKALNIGTTGTFGTSITSPSLISTGTVTLFSSATPTTTAAQMAFDNNAWAASFGAVQVHNGTANTFLVGVTASDTPSNGQVPTWNTGGGITWETPSGSGTVTVVGAGSLTSTALVTGGGTTTLQTPSATATMDSSGNISTPGTLTVGNAATTAGAIALTQGTTQSTGTTNITLQAPAAVTSYLLTLPGAVGAAGTVLTDAAGNGVLSWAAGGSSLTATQVGYGSAGNTLTGEAAFTYTAASNTISVDAIQLGATGVNIANDTDGAITFLGTSAGSDEDFTLNLDDTANTWTFSSSTGVTTAAFGGIGITTTGTNSIGPLVDSVDGTTPLNNINQVVAAGTVYTLTTSYASVDFGTTDPVLTIANAGTYSIYVNVQTSLVSATTTTQSVTYKLRRTNNTAADLAGSTFGDPLPVATIGSPLGPTTSIGPIKYTTANTNDSLTVQGILSGALGAGTATVTNCTITAIRAY